MEKPKLLLHICCGPCALYVFEKLKKEFQVTGFFYNPNIHPKNEYDLRKEELKRIAKIYQWHVIYSDYDMIDWFSVINGFEKEPEKGKRCSLCFNMRFDKTFEYAKEKDFEIVSSTLSISPYKDTEQINREGFKLSKEYGIDFLGESYKKNNGFNIGREMGKKLNVRRQNYCGCSFSKVDRIKYSRKKIIS